MRQTLIGLVLFSAILGCLLSLHVWSIFFVELSAQNIPLIIALVLTQTWLFVGIFITAHDAMHGALAPHQPQINRWIGRILLFSYAGFSWKKMRDAHMDHHKFPGTPADPDYHVQNPKDFAPWYWMFMTKYFGIGSFIYVLSVVLIYSFIFKADYWNIVIFYGLTSIASSAQLFFFGTYLPHRHTTKLFEDQHNARSNDFPVWLSLLTCYHFGYHHEHHLYPHEPWWRLPLRRKGLRATGT